MSSVEFLRVAAYIVIFGFLWKFTQTRLPDGSLRRGMAYVYN